MTISLLLDLSLFQKVIWMSCRPQNKAIIRGASLGIWYKLRVEEAICGRGWYIGTQERKMCGTEIKNLTIVINWSIKLTPSWLTEVNPGNSCSLSYLWSQVQRDTSGTGNSKNSWLFMNRTSSNYLYVRLNRAANFSCRLRAKSKKHSASHEQSNMSARRGAQLVPIGIPTICWKTIPA